MPGRSFDSYQHQHAIGECPTGGACLLFDEKGGARITILEARRTWSPVFQKGLSEQPFPLERKTEGSTTIVGGSSPQLGGA